MKIRSLLAAAVVAAASVAAVPAQAAIINFGVDVQGDGSAAQVGFYDGQPVKGGDNGFTLSVLQPSLNFMVNTPGLAGATINGFELFIDATDVDCNGDGCDGDNDSLRWVWIFPVPVPGDDKLTFSIGNPGTSPEYLDDTVEASTHVPTEGGPLGSRLPSPYSGDIDNSFYVSWAPGAAFDAIAAQIQAGQLALSFDWNAGGLGDLIRAGRIDGVNLKVDYTPAAVPEPASLLLLGAGLIGGAVRLRRRK